MQELNWLPRMVLALTIPPPSAKPQKFAGPAAAVLQLYPRFHLDFTSRLGTYPLHQACLPSCNASSAPSLQELLSPLKLTAYCQQ